MPVYRHPDANIHPLLSAQRLHPTFLVIPEGVCILEVFEVERWTEVVSKQHLVCVDLEKGWQLLVAVVVVIEVLGDLRLTKLVVVILRQILGLERQNEGGFKTVVKPTFRCNVR